MMQHRLIAVIPAYNEATRIASVVTSALPFVERVIVVADGSSDDTARAAREAGATVIEHVQNCGPGAGTMTGLEAARRFGATIAITLDGDEQHDASDIPALIAPILAGNADIALGNRFGQKNKIPAIRRFLNGIGNVITFMATGLYVEDSQCGFKAFGPRALAEVSIRMGGYEFCTEIVREIAERKWRYKEVPIKVMYSAYTLAKGQSVANGIRTAFRILLRSFLR